MIAIVSVELKTNDACVIVAMNDKLKDKAIEIVRERNKCFPDCHCYVQSNIDYVYEE
ncbi:hypothetical protein ACOMCU_24735 [Lysinibacillus sp. UGB7]|uniref:hypothetical protein n=1 Tax=Lysinibacillus sp. UGB7 TaxID=3411039 RepID=UPI003B7C2292